MRLSAHFIAAVALALSLSGCGKRGALIYPDLLVPSAPGAVSVSQSGAGIRLRLTLPATDKAGRRLLDLAGVIVGRRVDNAGHDFQCPACVSEYKPLHTLYLDTLPESVQRFGDRLMLHDGDVQVGRRYSYRLTPVTRERVEGASYSSPALELLPPIPSPSITVESLPAEIRVSFSASLPAGGDLIGYNLYRTTSNGPFPFLPLNSEPIVGTMYLDSGLERKTAYRYHVRTVARPVSGIVAESLPSDEAGGMLKDDE